MDNEFVKALEMAKLSIDKGTGTFVCLALPDNYYGNFIRLLISSRLGDELHRPGSITCWLDSVGIDWYGASKEDLKDYRVRWIDSLIEEFKKGIPKC